MLGARDSATYVVPTALYIMPDYGNMNRYQTESPLESVRKVNQSGFKENRLLYAWNVGSMNSIDGLDIQSTPPGFVHNAAPVLLSLLQNNGMPPLGLINRIHVPTRLNAESSPGSASRVGRISLRHIDPGARVELESRVGAVHLQVHARVCVPELSEKLERSAAGVDLDGAQVAVDDEAVVKVVLIGAELEGLCGVD